MCVCVVMVVFTLLETVVATAAKSRRSERAGGGEGRATLETLPGNPDGRTLRLQDGFLLLRPAESSDERSRTLQNRSGRVVVLRSSSRETLWRTFS